MSDTTELGIDVMVDPVTGEIIDERKLALQLLEHSKAQGPCFVYDFVHARVAFAARRSGVGRTTFM